MQSDERLIALTRRGQQAAFEVLCARYQSRLLAFCRHMLNSREDAEDVLQEVFTAAFNAVLADEREINVRPWLYRIARNRSLNHLRRATSVGVDSMDIHYAEGGISTGDKVMRRESFRELIDDVHKLPETQRTALLLREMDALSYEQIAEAMDTTVPSVKSLLVRARISLAEAAEARKMGCDEVRLELGEAAEGLTKISSPARRHVRECDRCTSFRGQLKANNTALAAILPVGPLLLAKKFLLAKLGITASAGGHVAGGAGAGAGAAGAGAGAAAAGGSGIASSLVTAGAGALATKAAIVTAAAAIVTAGAVAAGNAVSTPHHRASTAAVASAPASAPVIVGQALQPTSATHAFTRATPATAIAAIAARERRAHARKLAAAAATTSTTTSSTSDSTTATVPPVDPALQHPKPPAPPQPTVQVTTQTTELPPSATATPTGPTGEEGPVVSETPPPAATPEQPSEGSTGATGTTGAASVEQAGAGEAPTQPGAVSPNTGGAPVPDGGD